ncbi:hypothetical protein MKW98_009113 [Papaver atlanticum]|uniref:Uncharacterized protein n=1 Tax=Papaver atlanticum TaxID=357466 RepID=A0AAD4XRV3_9MAGN|nr:hypothetical protein MKW98_009113 [Papaver atlanticum]
MQKLVRAHVHSHPYIKWFKEYSYESFETSHLHSEDVLDELSDSLTDKEVEVIERLYCRPEQTLIIPMYTKLDPKVERLIVASLEILANIEILTAQKPDQQLLGEDRDRHSQITSIDSRKTWELLSQQHTLKNDNFIKQIMLGKKAVSFDYEGLKVNNLDASVYVMPCWDGDLTRSALSGECKRT